VVVVAELDEEEPDEEAVEHERDPLDKGTLRLELTRSQAAAFSGRAVELVAAGRPACRFCGLPIDQDGHACPRMN
jgi:uncharacterized repeat protein (TIGR03847 family)